MKKTFTLTVTWDGEKLTQQSQLEGFNNFEVIGFLEYEKALAVGNITRDLIAKSSSRTEILPEFTNE